MHFERSFHAPFVFVCVSLICSVTCSVVNISVVDLFKELPQFLVKAAPTLEALYGDSWEKHLQVRFLSSGSCGSMEVILPWTNGFEITTCILPVGAGPGEGSASQYCPCDSSLQVRKSIDLHSSSVFSCTEAMHVLKKKKKKLRVPFTFLFQALDCF